ncbi:MAG: hypothetical protein A2Z62_02585 [Candidatus Terrybacteria bacterium RIFCSPLOWO2_02_42_20]|nr:MAG: hypothetical protein A2Z62_02585 [Candidatus Terrybacteria bacterium RIFCSPLOWO2_02_42_20]
MEKFEEFNKKENIETEKVIENNKIKKDWKEKIIEIPELERISFFEKQVLFSKNIIEDTGGVKGYIRKFIQWDELTRVLSKGKLSSDKILKIKNKEERTPKEQKIYDSLAVDNEVINNFLSTFTDGDFPTKTANHVFCGVYGQFSKSESLKKFTTDRILLQKIKLLERIEIQQVDIRSGKIKNEFFQDKNPDMLNLTKKNVYYRTAYGGLSVSKRGDFWYLSVPYKITNAVIFGFGLKNKAFQNYLEKAKFYVENEYSSEEYSSIEYLTGRKNYLNREHPVIPIMVKHPDVTELRWCHADYASIPTKKGLNILEMITDKET